MITVLRLGHRVIRDQRVTTHVALTARAFGADSIIISGERDDGVIESIEKVCTEFGGGFGIEYAKNWKRVIEGWKKKNGVAIHLTMYGEDIDDKKEEIMEKCKERDMLIIVGGPKVPFDVYKMVDYNIAVGNQPHSEVAALAIVLDRLVGSEGRKKRFMSAKKRILPNPVGKTVVEGLLG